MCNMIGVQGGLQHLSGLLSVVVAVDRPQPPYVQLTTNLHPSRCNDALEGVRDQLNVLILRWNQGLRGVPLAYSNERVVNSLATIHSYFPYMQVEATAELLLFRPRLDLLLSGKVVKAGADFLGLHVLGVFNAAIGRQHIRPDLAYRSQAQSWQSRGRPEHCIAEGDEVIFKVLRINTDGGMVSLAGSLEEEATGEVGFLRRATGALPPQQPYHKATSRSEALEQQHMAPADVAGPSDAARTSDRETKPRSKKRRRHRDVPAPAADNSTADAKPQGGDDGNHKKKRRQKAEAQLSAGAPLLQVREPAEQSALHANGPAPGPNAADEPHEKKKLESLPNGVLLQAQQPVHDEERRRRDKGKNRHKHKHKHKL